MRRVNLGSRRDDELSFDGGQRAIFARRGDDTISYDVTEDSDRWRYVDGGRGEDTLVLELTEEQWATLSGGVIPSNGALPVHAAQHRRRPAAATTADSTILYARCGPRGCLQRWQSC